MVQELKDAKGGCACGAVRFVINGPVSSFHLCYCSRCRHSTGSAHASNIFMAPENIEWLAGEEYIQRFELPEAPRWTKQFCRICGCSLPYASRDNTYLVVPAGSLDGEIDIEPDDKIFCESRARWVERIESKPEFGRLPEKS